MAKKTTKIQKTNALRILDGEKVAYSVHQYDIADGVIDGRSVCDKLGLSPVESYKTLVGSGKDAEVYVYVVPIESELDLKKAAMACGEKKVELIAVKDILAITGYIRGGCSPIGMKKKYKTYIDSAVLRLEKVYVSGGKKGMTIGLNPQDLVKASRAELVNLVK
ncbi:Cys-tRNA(Pro) deacylase [Myroides pelagicus]|uniref:Cys-tRNA(Pro)/Cys-tRNA(Cys) deacylase n=1 Tax=Myroides pelagicus TaxID=270914 RepID=A0A7K1GLN1_9FLAO|nr:Cys-tRNA(Pro) deacylase [Myroides pelagicus]MTH29134.1 Cys-tRNA(Pro) deacylase [Myroides pelagicus]